ncbi:undecaprenyl phosphate translocase family protein, partial [Enterococcus hirae]
MITEKVAKDSGKDWLLRFVKGMFIGSGFILPGVSGGALAAVFGIYERLISFLAHLTRNFKENVLFFLPVGLG